MLEIIAQLTNTIRAAAANRTPLCIRGGGSKDFYGGAPRGEALSVAAYRGIIDYDPSELVITAQRFRTQPRNREDALERLVELIRQASVAPKLRRATRPTKASKERRLTTKNIQAQRKRLRAPRVSDD